MPLKKPLRRTLSIGGLVLLLFAAIQGYALFFLGPVLASQLNQRLNEASQGLYHIRHKNARLNLLNGSLVLVDFSLTPDSSRYQDLLVKGEIKGSLYHVTIPRLRLSGMSVYEAFATEKLEIRHLVLDRPQVKVLSRPQSESGSFYVANLYELTEGRFTSLNIQDLEIRQGEFQMKNSRAFGQNAFTAKDVSVHIRNFRIDSTARFRMDRTFYAEDIEVGANIVDYSFVTPDSSYEIQIGQLGLSTSREEAFAEDIRVRPRQEHFLDLRMEGQQLPWLAEIRLPRISLEGLDLHELMFDSRLLLRRVHLQQPGIRLISSGQVSRLEEDVRLPSLYPFLQPLLKEVKIDRIEVENAGLDIEKDLEDPRRAAAVRGVELQLLDFRIDSSVEDLPFLASDLRLEVRDYGFWLAGDDYLLQGQNLWLSTQSRFMLSDSLRLIPSQEVYQAARQGWGRKPEVYEIFVPTLMVEGVDIRQLYFTRELEVNKIYLGGPELWLTNYPRVEKEKVDALARSNFYEFIEGMLYLISIHDLEIEEGILHFNDQNRNNSNTFTARDISVDVVNFRVDSLAQKEADNPFYADDIDVNFDLANYTLTLPDSSHRVTVGELGFSAADSSLYAGAILFQPTSYALALPDSLKPSLYRVFLPRLELAGLDAKGWYFDKDLMIRSIRLEQPALTVNASPGKDSSGSGRPSLVVLDSLPFLLKDRFRSVSVQQLEIRDAGLTYDFHDAGEPSQLFIPNLSLSLSRFYVDSTSRPDPRRFAYADDLSVHLKQYTRTLFDSLYRFSLGAARFSTAKGGLELDSIRLYPIGLQSREKALREGGMLYDVFVPGINLEGIPTGEVYRHRQLALDSIRVRQPVVTLTHYPLKGNAFPDTLARPDLYQWLSPFLKALSVEGIAVENGIFRYRDGRKGPEKDFNARNISVGITRLKVDSTIGTPFYADDIALGLNVNEYSFLLPDSSYEVRAGRIEVSTGGSFISVDSIRLLPQHQDRQGAAVLIPQLQMEGLSFPDLYFYRDLDLAALRLIRPYIRMQQPLHLSSAPGQPQSMPDLYEKLSGQLKRIHIGRVEVHQGHFLALSPALTPIQAPEFSVVLENFQVDSLSRRRIRQFFFAEEMQVSLADFRVTTPDSMYDLSLGTARLSSCDRRILIDSLRLTPRYGVYEFGEQKGYSQDRISLLVPKVRIEGFNAWAAANQQRFLARKLIADGFDVQTFRDRRLPDMPGRHPLLLPEILPGLPFHFHLDTMTVLNGRGVYKEHATDASQIGWLSFGDLFATLTPLSNDTLLFQRREEMVVNARCKLMDQGILRVRFSFTLGDTALTHTYTGIMEPMDMAAINTITEPAASVKIRSGRVDKLYFNVEANRHASKGRMRFYYHDFRVQVLNKKKGNQKGIESFFANSFLVRTHNPSRRFLRIGQIEFERDPGKSMFNYLYKTLLSGLTSSIGMKKKKDRIKNRLISPTPEIQ